MREQIKLALIIVSCPMFLVSAAAYIYVRIRLRPKDDSDLDDYYHEFEHLHPGYAKYTKFSNISLTAAIAFALLMFIAAVI